MAVFIKRLVKKFSAFFVPIWKIFLKSGYRLVLYLKPEWRQHGWKFLWYLRQWAHPPIHILGRPQYAVADYRGFKIKVHLGEMTGGNLYYGRPGLDEAELDFLENFLKPGSIVLDVGANIGVYTLVFARAVTSSGKIYSFEPVSKNLKIIRETLKFNNVSNVALMPIALSDKRGEAEIFLNSQSGLSSFVETERGTICGKEKVKCETIDEFVKKENLPRLDFIKIDVEGFEGHVLKGGLNALKKFKPALFVELDPKNFKPQGFSQKEIVKWLLGLGYKSFVFNRRTRILEAVTPPKDYYEGINFLFI